MKIFAVISACFFLSGCSLTTGLLIADVVLTGVRIGNEIHQVKVNKRQEDKWKDQDGTELAKIEIPKKEPEFSRSEK